MLKNFLIFLAALAAGTACSESPRRPGGNSGPENPPAAIDRYALFTQYCASCHGVNGTEPVNNAINLAESRLDEPAIRQMIRTGRRTMPGFESMLSPAQIDSLALHVKYLQH